MDAAIQFLVAIVATISFGVTFRVPARHYLPCGLTGAVGWLVYIVCLQVFAMSAPVATLVAALPLTACARFFAVRHKAPITLFLLCGIFPLVPGAGIYYTAYYFLRNDRALFVNRGVETLKIAVALALGIALVCSIPRKRPHPGPSCYRPGLPPGRFLSPPAPPARQKGGGPRPPLCPAHSVGYSSSVSAAAAWASVSSPPSAGALSSSAGSVSACAAAASALALAAVTRPVTSPDGFCSR